MLIFTVKLPPTLNEIIGAYETIKTDKGGRKIPVGRKQKEYHTNRVAKEAKIALRSCPLSPIFLIVEYNISSRSRDIDNIQATKKFIFDGLVNAHILKKDSLAWFAPTIYEYFNFVGNKGLEGATLKFCTRTEYKALIRTHINELT